MQVVQTVQIDLQKFRFTAPGSNLAFILKNIAQNFYNMQKGNVIAFDNTVNYFVTFLLGLSIYNYHVNIFPPNNSLSQSEKGKFPNL